MRRGISVGEAALRLGVSHQRVRAMAGAGRIPAVKLGREWLIDLDVPHRREVRPGRPLSSAMAWATLALIEGDEAAWVGPSARSRLRRRMRDPAWVERWLVSGAPRSEIHRWRVLPSDLPRIQRRPGLVLSGLSAGVPGLDVVPVVPELDAYVDADGLADIRRRFLPDEAPAAPNLALRIPLQGWILILGARHAPPAVVAADLLDSDDPRVRRAAQRLLRGSIGA